MTKTELKQIYHLNREIRMWQRELSRLREKSPIGSPDLSGEPHGSGISDKVGDMATTIADIELIIQGKLAEIQVQRKKVMDYIDGVEDSQMRQIITLRHVNCMKWNEIADEVGGNEDSVRKAYCRYLKTH